MDYHIVDHAIWENVLTQLFLKHYVSVFYFT